MSSNTNGEFSSVIDISNALVTHRSLMALCGFLTCVFIFVPVMVLGLHTLDLITMDIHWGNITKMLLIGVVFLVLSLLVHYKGFNDAKALAYKKKPITVTDDIMNVSIDYFDVELMVDELTLNQIDIIFKAAISYELSRKDCNDLTDKMVEMNQGFRHYG